MPIYEYWCDECGDFSSLRPMAESAQPQPCPECGASAPRVVLNAPNIGRCSSSARAAHRRNERSAESPARGRATRQHGHHHHTHPASAGRGGGSRPWMLSH